MTMTVTSTCGSAVLCVCVWKAAPSAAAAAAAAACWSWCINKLCDVRGCSSCCAASAAVDLDGNDIVTRCGEAVSELCPLTLLWVGRPPFVCHAAGAGRGLHVILSVACVSCTGRRLCPELQCELHIEVLACLCLLNNTCCQ